MPGARVDVVPSTMTPRARHIPLTRAQYLAWGWGIDMADRDMDIVTSLAGNHLDPGDLIDDEVRRAWDRLGPRRFWTWALTGFNARAEEDIETV